MSGDNKKGPGGEMWNKLSRFFFGAARDTSSSASPEEALAIARREIEGRVARHETLVDEQRCHNLACIYQRAVENSVLAGEVLTVLHKMFQDEQSAGVRDLAVLYVNAIGRDRPELALDVFHKLDGMFKGTTTGVQWQMPEMVGRVAVDRSDLAAEAVRVLGRMAIDGKDEFIREGAVNWIGKVAGTHYAGLSRPIVDLAISRIDPLRVDESARVRKTADEWIERLDTIKPPRSAVPPAAGPGSGLHP